VSLKLHRVLPFSLTTWNHPAATSEFSEQWYPLGQYGRSFSFFGFVGFGGTEYGLSCFFQISRLRLNLISTHPDSAGGLAFISTGHRRFAVLVFAISSIYALQSVKNTFGGASLHSFELELTVFFLICVAVVLGPLVAFSLPLIRSKLKASEHMEFFSAHYTQEFDEKWIQHKDSTQERLLGSPDIQSLADMKNSFEGVAKTRTFLPDRRTISILLIAYLIPVSPLLTTVIPLRQIVSEVFKLLQK